MMFWVTENNFMISVMENTFQQLLMLLPLPLPLLLLLLPSRGRLVRFFSSRNNE